jgi:hypothetical protein
VLQRYNAVNRLETVLIVASYHLARVEPNRVAQASDKNTVKKTSVVGAQSVPE